MPVDTGIACARHDHLHKRGIETFCRDTHSPWQKGGGENALGRLRRTLPRKTDRAALPEARFTPNMAGQRHSLTSIISLKRPCALQGNAQYR